MTTPLTLYWISGSPPAWRVMLFLTLKELPYQANRLDHAAKENRTPEYLAINPTGQVPTLVAGDLVIRESIAIMAWLERAFPERPLFGDSDRSAASIWQELILMENELRPAVTTIARTLLRKETLQKGDALSAAGRILMDWADDLSDRLQNQPFLSGDQPAVTDLWLYPSVGWIERAVEKSGNSAPKNITSLLKDRPSLENWQARLAALPGVAATYPPHWRE